MGERIRITDVSPRDGLQNEAGIIPTAEKVELVRLLCQTGARRDAGHHRRNGEIVAAPTSER